MTGSDTLVSDRVQESSVLPDCSVKTDLDLLSRKNSRKSSTRLSKQKIVPRSKLTRVAKTNVPDSKLKASPLFKEDPKPVPERRSGRIVGSDSGNNVIAHVPSLGPHPQDTKAGFVEPELAQSSPSYTGYSLEQLPPPKIKKESCWPIRKGSVDAEAPPDNSRLMIRLNNRLNTKVAEKVTKPSHIRHRQTLKLHLSPKTPAQHPTEFKDSARPSTHPKRIKVILSPQKKAVGLANALPALVPRQPAAAPPAGDDAATENDDFCARCGLPGTFICCETCPRLFHFECCFPPFEEPPLGDWHCRKCEPESQPPGDIGLFQPLLAALALTNPSEFTLPCRLQEDTFLGVMSDPRGDYTNDDFRRPNKLTLAQIPGHNYCVDLEVDSLCKKDGSPYLCYRCGLSGLHNSVTSPLLRCEYCPQCWHLDCVPEPMCAPKTMGLRWKCPLHTDDMAGSSRFRQLKSSVVVDSSLHNQFIRKACAPKELSSNDRRPNLNILIRDGEPYTAENRPTLAAFVARQHEENTQDPPVELGDGTRSLVLSRFTPSGVLAKTTPSFALLLETCAPFVYRVPERLVVLDFITRVHHESPRSPTTAYDREAEIEETQDNLVATTLLQMSQAEPLNLDWFGDLVDTVPATKAPALEQHELHDLRVIKRMVQLKGKEALLQFLQL